MAKLSAGGHRPVARWISGDRSYALVLRSDGAVLRGHSRPYGGYDYSIMGRVKPGTSIEVAEAAAARIAARLGLTRA